jgi:hypothetical protein
VSVGQAFECQGCGKPRYASRRVCADCQAKERQRKADRAESQLLRGRVGEQHHAVANLVAFERFCQEVRLECGVPTRIGLPSPATEGPGEPTP